MKSNNFNPSGLTEIQTRIYHSPCGDLMLGALGDRLCLCDWEIPDSQRPAVRRRLKRLLGAEMRQGENPVLDKAAAQLDEYFAGTRREFTIPLLPVGTLFQLQAWGALLTIPYGTTITYGAQAASMTCPPSAPLGHPLAARAVGSANSAHLLSLFIPCHRVVTANFTPGGYAGGLAALGFLQNLEEKVLAKG